MTVTVIRDALSAGSAEKARALFLGREFDHAPFQNAAHYARNLPKGGFGIPDHDEIYSTDFHTTDDIPEIRQIVVNEIVPVAATAVSRSIRHCLLFFYKFNQGGHLRMHHDGWGGHTGFVWHLSKGWKWDWGGLMVAVDGEKATTTLPVFNTLVLIDHAQSVPHLVTQVAPWAREPRMVVTGILR